jgi:hypothetical protein
MLFILPFNNDYVHSLASYASYLRAEGFKCGDYEESRLLECYAVWLL